MFTTSASAVARRTRLGSLTIAYPFPTYRGSLVVGAGVFRARSNELQSARLDRRPGFDDEFRRSQRTALPLSPPHGRRSQGVAVPSGLAFRMGGQLRGRPYAASRDRESGVQRHRSGW